MRKSNIDHSVCHLYEPGVCEPTNNRINPRGSWQPLYPVALGRPDNYKGRRGWFWLFECEHCGTELVSFTRSAFIVCECRKKTKEGKLEVICEHCTKQFTKERKRALSDQHHYCCDECKDIAMQYRQPTAEWLALGTKPRPENLLIKTPTQSGGIYDEYFG